MPMRFHSSVSAMHPHAECQHDFTCSRLISSSLASNVTCVQRDLPWELDSSLHTVGRTDLEGTIGAVGKPNFGSHFRIFTEEDGSRRLVGTSFEEDLRQGKLTFFEYSEDMDLLYRTTAELPVWSFSCVSSSSSACRILSIIIAPLARSSVGGAPGLNHHQSRQMRRLSALWPSSQDGHIG